MRHNYFARVIASLLIVIIIAPTAFFAAPRPAQALFGLGDIVNDPLNGIILAGTKLVETGISALIGSLTDGYVIKEYVLDGIAWGVSQTMLQTVTGSVVNFVNGQGNESGQPQYIQNLLGNLQGVGDNQAFAFLSQFSSQSNSPFAAAITSSLRTNYLQGSSLAGFFGGNRCTLDQYSSDINGFLRGNWSQGGIGAWFALTTQDKNNPYTLHRNAQGQLASLVEQSQFARVQDYQAGNGFVSWCKGSYGTKSADAGAVAAQTIQIEGGGTLEIPAYNDPDAQIKAINDNFSVASLAGSVDSQICMNSDGTAGTVETPGSVIHDSLGKALGSGVDKIISADEIDEILGQLAIGLVASALGGSSGGLGGLSRSSGGRPSYIDQYQSETAATTGTNAVNLAQTALTNVAEYEAAWNTIDAAADTASTALTALLSCSVQASAAQSTLDSVVKPVIAKAGAAIASAEKTKALAIKVQSNSASTAAGAQGALLADTQALGAAPPSASDLTQVKAQAQNTGSAAAVPAGSLNVTGATTVDQMMLIAQNADALRLSCGTTP